MKAYFTIETAKKLKLPCREWRVIALELEDCIGHKHYSVKIAIENSNSKKFNNIDIEYYDIDYLKNKKEVLAYFLRDDYGDM